MTLGEKLRFLRSIEGTLSGLDREMTQEEVARQMRRKLGRGLTQAYLSQIESGRRRHLTHESRTLLSKFFQVHPGFLVEDPEGFHTELVSAVAGLEDKLDLWLVAGAERFRRDPELARALLAIARHADSRGALLLLSTILETPDLPGRLTTALQSEPPTSPGPRRKRRSS